MTRDTQAPETSSDDGSAQSDGVDLTVKKAMQAWDESVDKTVRDYAHCCVKDFFTRLGDLLAAGQSYKPELERLLRSLPNDVAGRDAIVSFALFCRARFPDELAARPSPRRSQRSEREARPTRTASVSTRTRAGEAPQPEDAPRAADRRPSTAAGDPEAKRRSRGERAWKSRVRPLADTRFARLLVVLVEESLADSNGQMQNLLSLLQVYFELDWSSSVDLLQDIAFRAGMMLCDVAMRQPFAEQDPLMTLGCQLLNANAQFGQNYECRPLPKRGRLDMDKCEQPEGQGTGPDVMPMSFYIVRKPMNKVSRRARVRRA